MGTLRGWSFSYVTRTGRAACMQQALTLGDALARILDNEGRADSIRELSVTYNESPDAWGRDSDGDGLHDDWDADSMKQLRVLLDKDREMQARKNLIDEAHNWLVSMYPHAIAGYPGGKKIPEETLALVEYLRGNLKSDT